MRRFLAAATATLLLDQVTKVLVRANMELHETLPVIGEIVRLRFIRNAGAAFGLFQGSRILFITVSLVSIAVVIFLIASKRYEFRGSRLAFGLIFGGAVGNLIDRLALKEVTDFLDIGVGLYRWPTFNVADIAVTLGVFYLAASFLVGEGERERSGEEDEAGARGSGL